MSNTTGLTHILTELASLEELGQFIKRSSRLKYTGISVSRKYLALGSNKGGIYIFSRDTLKYLQVIFVDSETNPVTSLALSPTDQHLGVASSSGFVAVFELNIDKRTKPERVRQSYNHSGHTVTSITWDTTGSKLYVGDDQGRISALFVPTNKSKTLFTLPSEVMADLNVGVYQLTWWQDKLLVSTLTFCYLFDTVKHTYSTIGSKKREGEFGACIFIEPNSQCPVIYCARPGSRMWEVDFEGKVLNTHQLKQLLATPPVSVVNILHDSYVPSSKSPAKGGLSISFCKMIHVGRLILTWSSGGLYLFDPINVNVKIWTDSVKDIKDVSVFGNDIYIFSEQAMITKLTLLPIYQAFQLLTTRAKWQLMAHLLLAADQINIQNAIVKRVKKDFLDDLFTGLAESGESSLIEKVRAAMEDISESSVDSLSLTDDLMGSNEILGYTRLPSGMIIVNEGSYSPQPLGHPHNSSYGKVGESDGKYDLREEFSAHDARCFSPTPKEESSQMALYTYESQTAFSRAMSPLETGQNQHENVRKNGKQVNANYHSCNESPIPSSEHNNNTAHDGKNKSATHIEDTCEQDESTNFERSNLVCSTDGSLYYVENTEDFGHGAILKTQSTSPPDTYELEDDKEKQMHVTSEAMEEALPSQISVNQSGKAQVTNNLLPTDGSTEKNTFLNEESSARSPITVSQIQDSIVKDKHDLGRDSPLDEVVVSSAEDGTQHNNDQVLKTSNTAQWYGMPAKKRPQAFQDALQDKGSNESIAKSVKVGKKKPKAKQSTSSKMERSVSLQRLPSAGKMVASRSCSDLSQKAMYIFCDNEEVDVDVTLNTQELQEAGKEETIDIPSNDNKHSTENSEFNFSSEETALSPTVPCKAKKEEIIPPLIDRLAASKVYSNTDEGTNEESWTGSVLAMKDELSSKLKTQTISLLNKGKTLLVKSASSPHFSTHGVDSYRLAKDEISFQEDAIVEASDSADGLSQASRNPPISEKCETFSPLANQIHSLCLKAKKIEKKLKNHSVLMNPSKMVQLLDNWAKELNQVSFEFHYLQWEKLREESEGLRFHETTSDVVDTSDDSTAVSCMRTDMAGMLSLKSPESDNLSTDSAEKSFAFIDTCKADSELVTQNHSDSLSEHDKCKNSSQHSNLKELPTHKISGIPFEYLKEMYQVSDPFHLSVDQLKVFQKLTTLCMLSGATGDVFSVFNLTELSQQKELFYSFLPPGLDITLTSYSDSQLHEFKDCDRTTTNLQANDIVNTPVSLDQSPEKHDEEGKHSFGHSKLNGRRNELVVNEMLSDLQQALFLCLHFFAVDYNALKEEFDRRKDKLFLPWIALVYCCRENGKSDIVSSILADNQINSAIDYLRSGILLHPSALLGHIYNLFEHASAKTSEFCGEIPSNISGPDVVRLCWLRSKSPSEALMRYGKKIMIDLAPVQRPDAFKRICDNPVVRFLLLQSLLPFAKLKRDEVAQGDTVKSLAAQFQNVLPLGWLRILVSLITTDKERDSLLHLGMKLRNWKLCVKLLADGNKRDQMFKLIACIGDLDLLQENCLPETLDEWRILFKYCMESMKRGKNTTESQSSVKMGNFDKTYPQQENGTVDQAFNETASQTEDMKEETIDKDHQNENGSELKVDTKLLTFSKTSDPLLSHKKAVSWTDLGRCMLQKVNGLAAVDLLLEFLEEIDDNRGSLDPLLLNAFYTDFSILMEQDLLCHEALERMSVYMWTQKPSFMPTSLHHAIKSEALCKVNNGDDLNLQSMMSRINLSSPNDFMEEHSGNHWGFSVNLEENCPICNISLSVQLSVEVPGLFVFPCGHAFHKRCICNSKCPCVH